MRRTIALIAVVLSLTACSREEPAPQTEAPPAQKERSPPPTITGGAYRIYITNEMSGDLTVIDGQDHTVVATLPLGKRPRGLHASPDGKFLYVALSGSPVAPPGVDESKLPPADKAADGIGIVDLSGLKLLRVLRGYSDPEQLAVNKDNTRMYLASEDTGMALVADAQSGEIKARLAVGGEPEGVALTPDEKQVYMSSEEESRVSVIDTATDKVTATFPVGKRPRDIVFSPDGRTGYVTGESDASLTFVDVATSKPTGTLTLPGDGVRPMGLVVSPDGKRVFVATGRGGTVVSVDTATRAVVGTVAVGERPWGIAISPDGKFLYTANGPSNDVSVVDAGKLALMGKIPVGNRPWGVTVAQLPAP